MEKLEKKIFNQQIQIQEIQKEKEALEKALN